MVRVIFLLAQKDPKYRQRLLAASVSGDRWKKRSGKGNVTDRDMVNLATKLEGWTERVYKFGCAFIHLSDLHDHAARDPVQRLADEDRRELFDYLRSYHGSPPPDAERLEDVVMVVPMVFDKIASNLECYLKDLESGEALDEL